MSKITEQETTIAIFEPWSLGDAVIALTFAKQAPQMTTLYIDNRFVPILSLLAKDCEHISFCGLTIDYTRRGQGKRFLNDIIRVRPVETSISVVLSIRGDIRDYLLAKKLFPKTKIIMTGCVPFLARRFWPLDWLLICLGIAVNNRYGLWQTLAARLQWPFAHPPVKPRQTAKTQNDKPSILIHTGAQWRSKAYPYQCQIAKRLASLGYAPLLAYGPGDPNPTNDGTSTCLEGQQLITAIQTADLVICNDSAPMHLASACNVKALVLANVSCVFEWLPPGAVYLASPKMPQGYRPRPAYMSDKTVDGWMDPEDVVNYVQKILPLNRSREPLAGS